MTQLPEIAITDSDALGIAIGNSGVIVENDGLISAGIYAIGESVAQI